jgi:ATP-dependent DNA helicase RecG
MDAETVAAWLAAGEGEHTEFKRVYSSRVIESLVAFANTAGGRVLIGVDDRGQVMGLPDAEKVVESVLSACREAITPPLTPVVEIVRQPDGLLVVAQVEVTAGCMPRAAPSWSDMAGRRGGRPPKRSGC